MRFAQPFVAVFALMTLVACGGSPDATSPTPVPPSVAVTLVVRSGDAQESRPGSAVPTDPVVVARTAAGVLVAGVSVTFAIDSGGGTLSSTQATTGVDGSASPGRWTLGTVEGVNVVAVSASRSSTIRIRALASFPVTPSITNATVSRSGAVLTVGAADDPLKGLSLTIPSAAFTAGAQISIASKDSKVTTLPTGYSQVGPTIVITNSVAKAALPMLLTIPVTVQSADTALAAFYHDPASGVYELLPVAARTRNTLSVYARHFSADRLMRHRGAARIAAKSGLTNARVDAPYSPAQIIVVGVQESTLRRPTTTDFMPGLDDWDFTNRGTLPESRGICSGMSISAMYYFYAHRDLGRLFARFNPIRSNDYTNTVGLRFSTVAQRDGDWSNAGSWFETIEELSLETTVPVARLHYQALVMAMQVTKLPQLLELSNDDDLSHAVVAFASGLGDVLFADPNSPGLTRTMTFDGDAFLRFPFSARVDQGNRMVTSVRTVGASAVIDAPAIDNLWAQVADSTIGTALFTQVVPEFYDALSNSWRKVDTTKTLYTSDASFVVRTDCLAASCPVSEQRGSQYFIQTRLVNAGGTAESRSTVPANGATIQLTEGRAKVGVIQLSQTDAASSNVSWTNFRWLDVIYGKVALMPLAPTGKPDSTLNFTVRAPELMLLITKFTWDFGDGTALATTTSAVAAHAYTRAGTFRVLVSLYDATDRLIGRDMVTATIGTVSGPYSVWKISTATFANIGVPAAFDTGQSVDAVLKRKQNALMAYWSKPRTATVNPTLWVVKTPSSFNNAFDTQPIGVYLSDSMPGANGGRDPYPAPLALAGDVNQTGIDIPEFLPKWNVTGTVPEDGRIIATGALRGSTLYSCIGEFNSVTFVQAVDFAMSGSTGTGTITYTFRVVKPSCTRPNQELSRWQWVVTFSARRIR